MCMEETQIQTARPHYVCNTRRDKHVAEVTKKNMFIVSSKSSKRYYQIETIKPLYNIMPSVKQRFDTTIS